MTSNIDKLNLIAPLLSGREIYVVGEEQNDIFEMFGRFHSLEIDDVYPGSEPTAYFRAIEVKKKFSALSSRGTWETTWETIGDAELAFPASQLESIEQPHKGRLTTIQFFPRGTIEETTLMFTQRL